jgi:hypothetical protein
MPAPPNKLMETEQPHSKKQALEYLALLGLGCRHRRQTKFGNQS